MMLSRLFSIVLLPPSAPRDPVRRLRHRHLRITSTATWVAKRGGVATVRQKDQTPADEKRGRAGRWSAEGESDGSVRSRRLHA